MSTCPYSCGLFPKAVIHAVATNGRIVCIAANQTTKAKVCSHIDVLVLFRLQFGRADLCSSRRFVGAPCPGLILGPWRGRDLRPQEAVRAGAHRYCSGLGCACGTCELPATGEDRFQIELIVHSVNRLAEGREIDPCRSQYDGFRRPHCFDPSIAGDVAIVIRPHRNSDDHVLDLVIERTKQIVQVPGHAGCEDVPTLDGVRDCQRLRPGVSASTTSSCRCPRVWPVRQRRWSSPR